MKRVVSMVLAVAILVGMLPTTAWATEMETVGGTCGENLSWTFDESSGSLKISGIGDMDDYSWSQMYDPTNESSDIWVTDAPWRDYYNAIKSIDIESDVTSVGDGAFRGCSSVTSISLSNDVEALGEYSFVDCDGIIDIVIPENVKTIGEAAFSDCNALESVSILGAASIGNFAFSECANLISVELPETLTSIGEYGFRGCEALRTVTIPSSVRTIGTFAFVWCESLNEICFEGSAPSMDGTILSGLTCNVSYPSDDETWSEELQKEFDDTITWNGNSSGGGASGSSHSHSYGDWYESKAPTHEAEGEERRDCTGCNYYETRILEKLPDSGDIHEHHYTSTITEPTCTEQGFTTYICDCNDSYVDNYVDAIDHAYNDGAITTEPGCETTGIKTFTCANDPDHYYTEVVTAVGHSYGAWYETKAPTQEEEGEEQRDCSNCDHFETRTKEKISHNHTYEPKVTAPTCTEQGYTTYTCICRDSYVDDYVDAIGHAYDDGEITTKPGCEIEGIKTFTCANDPEHYYTEVVAAVGHSYGTWYETKAPTEEAEGEEQRDCENCDYVEIRKLEIKEPAVSSFLSIQVDKEDGYCRVTRCDPHATGVIVVPDSVDGYPVTHIFSQAFSGCDKIESVILPDCMEEIQYNAFSNCSSLTSIELGKGIRRIEDNAFLNCTKLKKLTVYDRLFGFDSSAVIGCEQLESIEVIGDNKTYFSQGGVLFRKYNARIILHVYPHGKEGMYIVPSNVDSIGEYAFYGSKKLTSITMHSDISGIGDSSFAGCVNLTEISLPNKITRIGYHTFSGCTGLKEIYIPSSITHIYSGAFMNCSNLEVLSIGSGLISIWENAFVGCTKLNTIDVSRDNNYLCSVDNVLFNKDKTELLICARNKNGTYILPPGVIGVAENAFADCSDITALMIPISLEYFNFDVFNENNKLTNIYYEGDISDREVMNISDSAILDATWHYNSYNADYEDIYWEIRYFRKWDADTQTAYWGEEPPIVEGLDLGSQVTAETDTSFIANVDNLVGTYVLAETKTRDDGMIAADILLSIKPLETKTGTITAIGFTTITIDGVEYSIPENVNVYDLNVGDSVMYHLYNGDLVGINGKGSADDDNDDSADKISTVRYYSGWDPENKTVTFGRDILSMAIISDDADTSLVDSLNRLQGNYVLVEINEQDGVDELISILPVESIAAKVEYVSSILAKITIGGTEYPVSSGDLVSNVKFDDYVLCHIYDGEVIAVEILQELTGKLMGWNKNTREVSIALDNEPDLGALGYSLSKLADAASVEFLNKLSSGSTTIVTAIQFACDAQGFIYHIQEPQGEPMEPLVHDGSFAYLSSIDNVVSNYTYHYDESWFQNSAYTYQHDLVKMSLRVAMAAGDIRCVSGQDNANGYDNIKTLMNDLGFDFSEENSKYPMPEHDSIGFAIGSKEIETSDSERATLIMIAVRGSGYGLEWGGNFRVGTTIDHEGFRLAADQVIKGLEDYIEINQDMFNSRIKVWISGFSRAAATTNLVAAYLDDGFIKQVVAEDVYAFCFECPQNTTNNQYNKVQYDNIVNIVNPLDIVTKVAMDGWDFGRFGTTYYLPSKETEENYTLLKEQMQTEYRKILLTNILQNFSTDVYELTYEVSGQASALDDLVDNLAVMWQNRSFYEKYYQASVIETIGHMLGEGIRVSNLGEVIQGIPGLLGNLYPALLDYIFADGNNIFAIKFTPHYMELCMAWLDSLDGLYEEDYTEYRRVFVNCPVDVEVYSGLTIVGRISDNVPESIDDGVATYIDSNGQKVVILPKNAEYTIKLKATDDGYMTYTVTEYNLDTADTERVVSYHDVKLTKGDCLNGIVEDLNEVEKAKYLLVLNDGQEAKPTIDQSGADVKVFNVNVKSLTNGEVHGGGEYVNGEFAKVTAVANEGYQFVGWFVEEKIVSTEAEYRFVVTNDVTITAQFKLSGHSDHVAGAEWVSDGTHHWHQCTGCDEKLDVSSHTGGTATCTEQAICSICSASCGEMASHDYKTDWNEGDENGHWHECKNCSAHDAQVKHTPGSAATETTAQICTECGYVIAPATGHITHTAGSKWFSDDNSHWHKCTGCNEKLDVTTHTGGTTTCTKKAICSVCGTSYGKLADHDYETSWSQGDASGHWHECKNCSAHDTQVKHTPGAAATEDTAQFCTVCGYVITPALGHTCTAGTKWYSNGTYHWHLCTSCGAWVKTSYHSYSSGTDESCNVCGYVRKITTTEPTEETEVAMTETTETIGDGEEVIATETAPTTVSTEANENLSDDAVSENTDSRGVSGVLITVFAIVALGSLAVLVILLVYKKRRKSE